MKTFLTVILAILFPILAYSQIQLQQGNNSLTLVCPVCPTPSPTPVPSPIPVGPLGSKTNPYKLNQPSNTLPPGCWGGVCPFTFKSNGDGSLSVPNGTTYFSIDPVSVDETPQNFALQIMTYNSQYIVTFLKSKISKLTGLTVYDDQPFKLQSGQWTVNNSVSEDMKDYCYLFALMNSGSSSTIKIWVNIN